MRIKLRTGLTSADLADYAFRDAYDSEQDPKEAADELLAEEGFE